jgi:hypothetical protein
MLTTGGDWNPKQKELKALLSKKADYREAIEVCLELHALAHDSRISSVKESFFDDLVAGLNAGGFRYRPEDRFASIAWNLWHITRIEDAVVNILIANGEQVLDRAWIAKIGTPITDTGNAMKSLDVDGFGEKVDMKALLNYRRAVGMRTRDVLEHLGPDDLRRKADASRLNRLLPEGVLLDDPESIWLADFWGKKTVSGLLTMPVTRHQIVHINDCLDLKVQYADGR